MSVDQLGSVAGPGPVTLPQLKDHLGVALDDEADDAALAAAVTTANAVVGPLPIATENPTRAHQGALLLAAALFTARNSPRGGSGAGFTQVLDMARGLSEIAFLLQIGANVRPKVG